MNTRTTNSTSGAASTLRDRAADTSSVAGYVPPDATPGPSDVVTDETRASARAGLKYVPANIAQSLRPWADYTAQLPPAERQEAIECKRAVLAGLVDDPEAYIGAALEEAQRRIRTAAYASGATAFASSTLGTSVEPSRVRVRTAAELIAETPEVPEAIWPGYIYAGSITELASKVKQGKSTLMLAASRAITLGQPFLGFPTVRTRVLYCSEERPATLSAAMRRVGLVDGDDFHIVLRHEIGGKGWYEFCEWVESYCTANGVGLVVVDTLSDWSGLSGDTENQAGAALEALRPVQSVAASGPACVVIRHERKSGGEVGDSGRGSSAFAGAVDVLMALRPVSGEDQRRELLAKGRFDGIPSRVVIELREDGTYAALGDPRRLRHLEHQRALIDALPRCRADAMRLEDLRLAAGGLPRTTAQGILGELEAADVIACERGVIEGHPRAIGYWLRGDE